ncbi:alpha/beta hydrolase [Streptosporangium sp. NPDC005286]|uniref:alpha/beta hydrolase n=1 Tax=Streptosporangium sp. NPDC005286 TaxID=3154463 RepID=UPI0033B64FA6
MTTTDGTHAAMHVPARDIPVPASVSEQARAFLAMGMVQPPTQWPPVDDRQAWRMLIAERNAMVPAEAAGPMVASCFGMADTGVNAEVEVIDVDGVTVYVATPDGVTPDDRRAYLAIHGGAFIQGGGELCRPGAIMTAGVVGARVWAVDYRMPPDHPFPTPLDDCLTVYRRLLQEHRPEEIVVGGVSAGANLTVALLLRARDEGLPLPGGAVVETVPADCTQTGDTLVTNKGIDITFADDLTPVIELYASGHDLRDPYLSPLFGDFTKGFPPTILTSGTRDFLLSDTVRLHRKLLAAGVPAQLHVFEAAPHAMFLGMAPEDHERAREIRLFVDKHAAQR